MFSIEPRVHFFSNSSKQDLLHTIRKIKSTLIIESNISITCEATLTWSHTIARSIAKRQNLGCYHPYILCQLSCNINVYKLHRMNERTYLECMYYYIYFFVNKFKHYGSIISRGIKSHVSLKAIYF